MARPFIKTLTERDISDLCTVRGKDCDDLISVCGAIRERFGGFLRLYYVERSALGVERGFFEVLIPNRKGRWLPDARAAYSR